MVRVYAITLIFGVVALLVVILGGALAADDRRRDPSARMGISAKSAIGFLVGFGMGGLSAEFSPLDLTWPVALSIATVAALLSVFWVRYAVRQSEA